MSRLEPSDQGSLFTIEREVSYVGTDPAAAQRETLTYDLNPSVPTATEVQTETEDYCDTADYALGELLLTLSLASSAGSLAVNSKFAGSPARAGLHALAERKGLSAPAAASRVRTTAADHKEIAKMHYETWLGRKDPDGTHREELPSLGSIKQYYYRNEAGRAERERFLAQHQQRKAAGEVA
ncbi:MAG: hypothetical protein WD467_02460 [Candidatus Saccharimonadales bacterium]